MHLRRPGRQRARLVARRDRAAAPPGLHPWLVEHPTDLALYADLKRQLAASSAHGEIVHYTNAKAALVYDIYERIFAADPAHPHDPQPPASRRRRLAAMTDAPNDSRTDPPLRVDEVATLRTFLDYHRDTFRMKCAGLDQAQLAQPLAPSTMTLGGMMKHLALVESNWFNDVFLGLPEVEPWASVDWDADRDWEWHTRRRRLPRGPLSRCSTRRWPRATGSSTRRSPTPRVSTRCRSSSRGVARGTFSLRWILVHLIEEYARHNGHADLIRESIDGVTGE